jgi:agmatine deiminase
MDRARADTPGGNAVAASGLPVKIDATLGIDGAVSGAACTAAVETVEFPLDDSWLRDFGPIYVVDDDGASRTAVHFGFNAWGEKFSPWDRDAAVGRLIAEHLRDRVLERGAEGGSSSPMGRELC